MQQQVFHLQDQEVGDHQEEAVEEVLRLEKEVEEEQAMERQDLVHMMEVEGQEHEAQLHQVATTYSEKTTLNPPLATLPQRM